MDNTTYNIMAPDVVTAARTVAREWPGVIEQDDIEQEIWVAILKGSQEAQDLVAGMSQAQRVSTLQTYGHRIAAKERDDYDLFSGNFFYSTHHVKELLRSGAITRLDTDPDTLMHCERMDLAGSLDRLKTKNARHVDVLINEYVHETPVHSHSQELTRAVDALTLEMNRSRRTQNLAQHDGPGSRKAMSNEQAQRLTRNDYKGQ